jgi:hypothetical protein
VQHAGLSVRHRPPDHVAAVGAAKHVQAFASNEGPVCFVDTSKALTSFRELSLKIIHAIHPPAGSDLHILASPQVPASI